MFIYLRLSVTVFLLSVMSGAMGASVSVNATELEKNTTQLDNSTKSLNGTVLKIREADLLVISFLFYYVIGSKCMFTMYRS